jgi:hypothetical protein
MIWIFKGVASIEAEAIASVKIIIMDKHNILRYN